MNSERGIPVAPSWYESIMASLNNLAGDPAVTAAAEQTRVDLRDYMLPIIQDRRYR